MDPPPPMPTQTLSRSPLWRPERVPVTTSPVPPGLARLWPALALAFSPTLETPAGTLHVWHPCVVNLKVCVAANDGAAPLTPVTVSTEHSPASRAARRGHLDEDP